MTENKFLYAVADQNGKFYYEANGLVQTQGQFRELSHAPDGFQDKTIEYKRDMKWFGVFRNFSFPLGFVRDGKSIVNYLRYKLGYEFRAFFIIYILDFFINDTQYGFGYVPYYLGEFDLTTVKKQETKIEVSFLDNGIESLLRANENTNYELPLDENYRLVKTDGIKFRQNATFEIPDLELQGVVTNSSVPMLLVNKEGFGINATVDGQQGGVLDPSDGFITAIENITFTLSGSIKWKHNNKMESSRIMLQRRKDDQFIENIFDSGEVTAQETIHERPLNYTITLNAGEHLYLRCQTFGTLVDQWKITYYLTNLRVDYDSAFKTTYTKVKTAHQAYTEIIDKATDGKYSFHSPYLEKRTDLVLTSGDGLRGFDKAKVKTSLSELNQWMWSNEDVYFGVAKVKINNVWKQVAVIGDLKDQFQHPVLLSEPFSNSPFNLLNKSTDLGTVRNAETDTAKEFLFNRIKVGCPTQTYDDINGRTEFNAVQHWGAPVTRDTKELDLTTSIREDATGIEYARSNRDGKDTTDASYDNDTFALWVNKKSTDTYNGVPFYTLDRTEVIVGVISPSTHFNAKFSPRHKLLRKARYLRSCLWGLDAGKVKITQAEKNADVSFNGVQERAEIPIGSLGIPYFTPDFLKMETPNPINLIQLQNDGDLRRNCFKFRWNEKDYYGFLHTVSIQPWMNEVQTVTLISSHKNDLSTI